MTNIVPHAATRRLKVGVFKVSF